MFNHHKVTRDWRGRELTLETGLMARQADGAVLAKLGGTAVLCTAVSSRSVAADQSFFPLTVMYQEKTFAAGKIPKGFFKREGRPSTKETLTSRLIDRPIRPLFHKEFKNETQVICTVLEHDMDNDPDVVALVGASAALTLSGVPFLGPIGGARIGIIDGEMVVNPGLEQRTNSDLDLLVAATRDGVLMVESEAKELSEKIMLEAVNLGFEASRDAVDAIIELAEHAAREPWETPKPLPERAQMEKLIAADGKKLFEKSYNIKDKQERTKSLDEVRKTLAEKIAEKFVAEDPKQADVYKNLGSQTIKGYESDLVRGWVLNDKRRIDGRDLKEVRQLDCRIGVLERTHGSALFTRGETQALAVTTLGTAQDEQLVDGLDGEYKERFMLHYNFPPFSVNEASPLRGPGRREIGHGKLAWRALNPLMPTAEQFPYTVRVVSEVLESNGSSSMATVCGASLALMNAGVPTTRPCAGIAMGLIKEGDKFAVLSDILGDEDHLGDMDFKVAGTEKGITALQMDIKITSITSAIMETALAQANANRMHILDAMSKAISRPQDEVSVYAPRIVTLQIPKEKIREVIGTGGKVIREICETTGAKIDIDDEGIISIASSNTDEIEHARKWIEGIVEEPEVGKVYRGKVMTITDFGAFVNFLGSRDGLVHISELADDRVNAVTDVISEGDEVYVYCHGIDDRGKVRLSMRMVDQESGKVRDDVEPPSSPSRRPSGGHGGRRDRDGGREGGRRGGGGGGGRFERRPPRSPDRY